MQVDQEKLSAYFSDAPSDVTLENIDMARLPRHVSVIMDGNGRWATARGLNRSENWNRPQHEVNILMHLFAKTFVDELPLLKRENVRVVFLGDISALPTKTREVFEYGVEQCENHTGMVLALAVNYGARAEIARACRLIAEAASRGAIDPATIDQDTVASKLYTAGLPDPELVIRTSGELRLSNYLLWQVAYAEFYVTDTYWPDFTRWDLLRAIRSFQQRDRRFGGLSKK